MMTYAEAGPVSRGTVRDAYAAATKPAREARDAATKAAVNGTVA